MTTAPTTRRSDIEGLRAVAILAVVLDHLLGRPVGGYLGVDVFFVVSGFVITTNLLREHSGTGRIDLLGFARRRALRLLPAAAITIAVTVVIAVAVLPSGRAASVARDAVFAAIGAANWHFAADGTNYFARDAPPSPLQHFWSLAVEEQFYLAWPLLMVLVLGWSRRAAVALVLVLAVASALCAGMAEPVGGYFATQSRVWELASGSLLAFVPDPLGHHHRLRRVVRACSGTVLLAVLLAGDERLGAPMPIAIPAVLAAAGIILSGGQNRESPRLVSAPAQGLASISYPLYLWHWPVIVLLPAVLPGAPPHVLLPLSLLVPLALSIATTWGVERPVRSWATARSAPERDTPSRSRRPLRHRARGRLGQDRSRALLAGMVALSTIAILLCVKAVGADQSRVDSSVADGEVAATAERDPAADPDRTGAVADPDRDDTDVDPDGTAGPALDQRRAAAIRAGLGLRSWPSTTPSIDDVSADDYLTRQVSSPRWADVLRCSQQTGGRDRTSCTFGAPDGRLAVLVGDSTAAFTMPALRQLVEGEGSAWRILDLARFGCPFTAAEIHFDTDGDGCERHKQQVVTTIEELQPDLVLVMNAEGSRDESTPLVDGLRDLLDETRTDAAIAFLLPNPVGPDIRSCAVPGGRPAMCETRPSAQQRRLVARLDGVRLVDTTPVWCASSRCPAVIDDQLVRVDALHVTPEAAATAASAMGRALSAAGIELGRSTDDGS